MTLYYWFLFISVILLVFFPVLAFIGTMVDNKQNAGNVSFLPILSVILSGLVPIVGRLVLSIETIVVLWQVLLGLIVFVSFYSCLKYAGRKKIFLFNFVLVLLLATFPFVFYGKLIPDSEMPFTAYLSNKYPLSIVTVCLPIFIIGMLIGYLMKSGKKNHNYSYMDNFSYGTVNDLRSDLSQLSTRLDRLSNNYNAQLRTMASSIDQLSVNILLTKYPVKDGSKSIDQKIASLLSKLKDDVDFLKSNIGHITTREINDDQVVLVRELSHFLATPLATIDASIKNLQATVKTKNEDKLNENAQRISSAVVICNGVLSTYREIFIKGIPAESDTLQSLITSSFELYKEREQKNLRLVLKVKNNYEGISNYYLLSTILPLLSNAVTASRDNSTIEIQESDGIVKISNTYEGEVDVSNFDKEGYSSKENHRGMGLFTVRHFLARRKLGNLRYYEYNNRIYFEIPIIPQNYDSTK